MTKLTRPLTSRYAVITGPVRLLVGLPMTFPFCFLFHTEGCPSWLLNVFLRQSSLETSPEMGSCMQVYSGCSGEMHVGGTEDGRVGLILPVAL